MYKKFIQKGPRDQSRGKEGRKCYRVRGQLDYCVVTVRSDPSGRTKLERFFATVLIQEKGPCLHIPYDNLPQWRTSHRWAGEEDLMLGEAATSQGC